MFQEVQENISSFIDGELDVIDRETLISELLESDDQKHIWSRYCTMGDAIKKTLPETLNHNLLQRIQFALESEPALLAPTSTKHNETDSPETNSFETNSLETNSFETNSLETNFPETNSSETNVVTLPVKKPPGNLSKPVFGFSIAASLTLAVVLAFQMNSEKDDVLQQVAVQSNSPSETSTSPSKITAESQQIEIASKSTAPIDALPVSIIELKPADDDAIYAEQSLMNDGRWTRITQVDGIPLASHFLSGHNEAHVQYKLQKNNVPLSRPMILEKASSE